MHFQQQNLPADVGTYCASCKPLKGRGLKFKFIVSGTNGTLSLPTQASCIIQLMNLRKNMMKKSFHLTQFRVESTQEETTMLGLNCQGPPPTLAFYTICLASHPHPARPQKLLRLASHSAAKSPWFGCKTFGTWQTSSQWYNLFFKKTKTSSFWSQRSVLNYTSACFFSGGGCIVLAY